MLCILPETSHCLGQANLIEKSVLLADTVTMCVHTCATNISQQMWLCRSMLVILTWCVLLFNQGLFVSLQCWEPQLDQLLYQGYLLVQVIAALHIKLEDVIHRPAAILTNPSISTPHSGAPIWVKQLCVASVHTTSFLGPLGRQSLVPSQ